MNESLEKFIELVAKHLVHTKERTIFSLGGRGYYENAASDMLAFFLQPGAEHGLGTLFLSAIFESMGMSDTATPEFGEITVQREARTSQGNKIDLQIVGRNWCLIVENKIRHIQNNPFDDYEAHAKTLHRPLELFTILSPNGKSTRPKWIGVKYADYCATLREHLGKAMFDVSHTKWHLFAREFILHIENELYTPTMNERDIIFIEEHTAEITKVQKMMSQYRTYFLNEMQAQIGKRFPGINFQIRENFWENMTIVGRCTSPQWNNNDMVIFKEADAGRKFQTRMYVDGTSEAQVTKAREIIQGKVESVREGKSLFWTFPGTHSSSVEAIKEFCDFVQLLQPVLTV